MGSWDTRSYWRTLGVFIGVSILHLCMAGTALADFYTVTRTDDPIPGNCEPADCSLREALTAANDSTSVDDVVLLPASATPYLIQYEELSLSIGDEIEVRGAGADKTVVKGDGKEIVFVVNAKATLSDLTITGGKGGIQSNTALTLRGVAVERNERNDTSGGIHANEPLTVESSFLGFNRSHAGTGGAIHANAPVAILNSTIAHNTSDGIGGVGSNTSLTISNSAIVFNTSTDPASAGLGTPSLTIRDSIFGGNRNNTGVFNCNTIGPVNSLGGNVSDDASCGAGSTDRPNVNPLLGTLALHGGTTPLYDLLVGSPAIDFAGQCPSPDQRGTRRPLGAGCDSGPYELVPLFEPPPPPGGDRELAMRLGKGKLRMDGKGRIRIWLTCPSTETSPPCRGRVAVRSRKGWPVRSCDCLQLPIAYNAVGRFSIPAGRTRAVVVRLPRHLARRLLDRWKPRRVFVFVTAEDAAGNRQGLRGFRKLVPR